MDWYVFVIFVVIIIGLTIALLRKKETDGILFIDTNDPNKDIYRLELGDNLEKLGTKKSITLKVIHGVISDYNNERSNTDE